MLKLALTPFLLAAVLTSGCATKMYEGNDRPATEVATIAGSGGFYLFWEQHTCILSINGKRAIVPELSRFVVLPGEVTLEVAASGVVIGGSSCHSGMRSAAAITFRAVAGRHYKVKDASERGVTYYWVEDEDSGERVANANSRQR